VVGIRGNVATRMAKLDAGEADATFLASAGLDRLGEHAVGVRLDPEAWLPAPAQAAIGIECRNDDVRVRDVLAAIDHAPSRAEVLAERRLLEGLGGGCSSPIAGLSVTKGDEIHLMAAIFSADGSVRVANEARFAAGDTQAPLELAARLLAAAPAEVRALFEGAA